MIGKRTDNAVENSQNVQQAGGNIGIDPKEHRRIIETILARHEQALSDQRADLEAKHAECRRADDAELRMQQMEIERQSAEIAELRRKLANPEAAYKEDVARVANMADRLDREANRFGAEKIAEAKAALAELDYSKAEELFQVIRADAAIAIDAAARAEFGLGEIAEARVDWADAAAHYTRAAELAPDFDRLFKAREFAWRAGDYPSADRLGQDLLAWAGAHGTQKQLATALNEHALTLRDMGRHEEAEPLYRQAIQIGKDTLGEAHPDYATRLNNLGNLLRAMGRYEEAEPLYRQAMQIDKDTLGEAHPDYAIDLNNLAGLLSDMGRYEEAEPLYRQAIQIGKDTLGEAHPNYAIRLNNMANLLRDMGRYEEAEPLYRQAIQIGKDTLGEAHPTFATRLNNLGLLLHDMGRYEEAEPLYRHAMEIDKDTLGEAHPDYATRLNNLAALYYDMERYAEAASLMETALRIWQAALPAGHPNIEGSRKRLAAIRAALPPGP